MTEFRSLLLEQIPHLRRYARSLLRGEDEADDLVQECLMRAMRNQHSFKPGTNMRGWMFTILHNLYIDLVRKRATARSLSMLHDTSGQQNAGPNQLHSVELGRLEAALSQLQEDQKSTLMLIALEGMSYQEVASITGVAVGTVKSRVWRAREALRELMTKPVEAVAEAKIARHGEQQRPMAIGRKPAVSTSSG